MSSFKCIIIEDEFPAQQILLKHLEKCSDFECIGVFTDVMNEEMVEKLNSADILFLDINLPSIDGLSFLKIKSPNIAVILTTAYSEYAVESYNHQNVVDYLLKPIRFERFYQALEKFKNLKRVPTPNELTINGENQQLFIKVNKEIRPIYLRDIIFIESLKDYVQIHLKGQKIVHHRNLKYWEETLPTNSFLRIHQSYIINTKKISKVHANAVEIENNFIPVGRKYKNVFETYKKSITIH